jgi:hypothetical protein
VTTIVGPFTPDDTVQRTVDPVTREILPPRLTTTDEQERQAIGYALEQMVDLRIWKIAVPVMWSRRSPTTLTVVGHAEHLAGKIIPVFDHVEDEVDEAGAPVDRERGTRFARLQDELEQAWNAEGL